MLLLIGLIATGVIGLSQTQDAKAPAFQVQVNDVNVGTRPANVQVPTVGTTTKQVEVPTVSVGGGETNQQ
jgi:cell division septation protein DedD